VSRRLLVINVALGIVSVVLAVGIFRTLLAKRPVPPPPAPRAVSAPAPAAAAVDVEAADGGPGAYGVIAARTLFNPSRSETTAVVAAPAAPVAKPILHGVVVDGAKSRAFLEDPAFKRVAGYSVGDAVGGGTIQKIADDRVVIVRPEGPFEVLLQDPSKPRPAPVATVAQAGAPQAGAPQVGTPQAGAPQAGVPQAGEPQAGAARGGPGRAARQGPRRDVPEEVGGPALGGSQQSPWSPGARQGRQRIPLQRQQGND
jgi:hypothetical protein